MELTKYTLFAGHTATGSIYQTVSYETENAKKIQFWFVGPVNAGVGSSATIWFEHAENPEGRWEVYPALVLLGQGGGTVSSVSWRSSANIASGVTGSMVVGYVEPNFMPSCLRVKYELSGVAASASAGTISAWMSMGRDSFN